MEIPKSTDDAQTCSVNDEEQSAQDTKAESRTGRPRMDQWRILVLGTLRMGRNTNYDRLRVLANHHRTLRQMLGRSDWFDDHPYEYALNTIKDNVWLFTLETVGQINQEVVRAGHQQLKKSPTIARSNSSSLMSTQTG